MANIKQSHSRYNLPECITTISRYPAALPKNIKGMSLKNRFKTTLEEYPITIKKITSNKKNLLLVKCIGIGLSEESFDVFIKRWIIALWSPEHKQSFTKEPNLDNSSVDLVVDGDSYKGVYPLSDTCNSDGYYSFHYID